MEDKAFVSGMATAVQQAAMQFASKFISEFLLNKTIGDLANIQAGNLVSVVDEATKPLSSHKTKTARPASGNHTNRNKRYRPKSNELLAFHARTWGQKKYGMTLENAYEAYRTLTCDLDTAEFKKWEKRREEYGIRKCVMLLQEGRQS